MTRWLWVIHSTWPVIVLLFLSQPIWIWGKIKYLSIQAIEFLSNILLVDPKLENNSIKFASCWIVHTVLVYHQLNLNRASSSNYLQHLPWLDHRNWLGTWKLFAIWSTRGAESYQEICFFTTNYRLTNWYLSWNASHGSVSIVVESSGYLNWRIWTLKLDVLGRMLLMVPAFGHEYIFYYL